VTIGHTNSLTIKQSQQKMFVFFVRVCCFCLTFIGNCLKGSSLARGNYCADGAKINQYKILKNNNFSEALISAQRAASLPTSWHNNSLTIKQSQQKILFSLSRFVVFV